MLLFLLLVAATFCLFGFIVGVWAKGFEQLQVIPLLIVTPLTFLGGSFYSIDMLPEPWRTITLFNPVVYLINGFRWTFFGQADVPVLWSLLATLGFFGPVPDRHQLDFPHRVQAQELERRADKSTARPERSRGRT
jgi:ABC-2 type transport system permease protein